jgi:hypothetical protein
MLGRCCAAVFVIRGDDIVRHVEREGVSVRKKAAHMPRGNLLVEFGLVAGRLGRRQVALCRLEQVDLPSDLAGMTIIDMVPQAEHPDLAKATTEPFSHDAMEKLRHWTTHLIATAAGIERTSVLHGYTGRWNFNLNLTKWRGIVINVPESYAMVDGSFDLIISAEGVSSVGSLTGTLSCRLVPSGNNSSSYVSDLHVFHTVREIQCKLDGSIELTSTLLGMQKLREIGEAPAELRAIGTGSEPWDFKWAFYPSDCGEMAGKVTTSGSGGTEGDITARKLHL